MAEYNSAYTGQQIDGAVGAVIENKGTWDNKVSAAAITIPKGRVKGDVDGDGKWTENDVTLISKYVAESVTPTDIEKWCADLNGTNSVDAGDSIVLQNLLKGVYMSALQMADYYGNWSFDADEHYWTTDIAVDGVTSGTDVVLNISGFTDGIQYFKAQTIPTGIRLYAYMPPSADVPCLIEYALGTGTVVINSQREIEDPDVFFATYGETTRAELNEAFSAGKALFCNRTDDEGRIYSTPLSRRTSTGSAYFFGPDYDGHVLACRAAGWARTEQNDAPVFVATYGTTTYSEIEEAHDAGKLIALEYPYTSSITYRIGGGTYWSGLYKWRFFDASSVYKGQDIGVIEIRVENSGWSVTNFSVPYMPTSDAKGKILTSSSGPAGKYVWKSISELGISAESPSHQVTLTASGWNSTTKQQTVTCADILADVTKQEIHAMPVDTSADNAYDAASIRPVAQAANSLTFYAETIPTADIDVYVAIHPLKFS